MTSGNKETKDILEHVKTNARQRQRPSLLQKNSLPAASPVHKSKCNFFGREHPARKDFYPAFSKTCAYCGKKNHFKIKIKLNDKARVEYVDVDNNNSSREDVLGLHNTGCSNRILGKFLEKAEMIQMQIDSGASVNVLHNKYVPDNEHIYSVV